MAKQEETRASEEKPSKEADPAEEEERDEAEGGADGASDDSDDGEESDAAEGDEKGSDEDDDGEEERVPEKASKRGAEGRPARPRPVRAAPPPPPPATNLGARVVVFVAVLLVLSSGFWLLAGFDSGLDKPVIKWRVGQVAEIDITLVKDDAVELACGSTQEVNGKKCEYGTKSDKNAGLTDATMLKPYTTADGVNFAAAGLWSQPALDKSKLPSDRFTVHCKFKVEGMLKTPLVRWKQSAPWGEKKDDWYAGAVSDCKLNPP
jgi:hypothetical protein